MPYGQFRGRACRNIASTGRVEENRASPKAITNPGFKIHGTTRAIVSERQEGQGWVEIPKFYPQIRMATEIQDLQGMALTGLDATFRTHPIEYFQPGWQCHFQRPGRVTRP
jgi:hypothetical protein